MHGKKYYSSVCVMAKNDVDLLEIFIPYYFLIGFEHIYLIDNNSLPSLKEYPFIKQQIDSGKITYFHEIRENNQVGAYNYILNKFRPETTWMAIVDTDEFLVLHDDSCINDFLKRYEEYGSVSIGWYIFGSNGHEKHQPNLFNAYTKRVPISCHYKTISYTDRVFNVLHHHVVRHKSGFFSVDAGKNRVKGPYALFQETGTIQLNHYFCRSLEDTQIKMKRHYSTDVGKKKMDIYDAKNSDSIVLDESIIKSLDRIYPDWFNHLFANNFSSQIRKKIPDFHYHTFDYEEFMKDHPQLKDNYNGILMHLHNT